MWTRGPSDARSSTNASCSRRAASRSTGWRNPCAGSSKAAPNAGPGRLTRTSRSGADMLCAPYVRSPIISARIASRRLRPPSSSRARWAIGSGRGGHVRKLLDGDVHFERHGLADEPAARLEGDVPVEPPVLSVDLGLGGEAGPAGAVHSGEEAEERDIEVDRTG